MDGISRPILNLTQHQATAGQRADGVIEPQDPQAVRALLTFDSLPDGAEIQRRASALAALAKSAAVPSAMIGGAPWLMAPLERVLLAAGITPVYAFSRRCSVDVPQADGSVHKQQVFRHLGFVRGKRPGITREGPGR